MLDLLYGGLQLLNGLSTGLGIMGSLSEGQSTAQRLSIEYDNRAAGFDAQADADIFNAKVARQMMESDRQRTTAEINDYRRVNRAKMASRRAMFGKSNLVLEGSPLLVDESIFQEMEFGQSRLAFAGMTNRARFETQAQLLDHSAAVHKRNAAATRAAKPYALDSVRTAATINAIGAGVSGVSKSMYYTLSSMQNPWSAPSNPKPSTRTNWSGSNKAYTPTPYG